MGSLLTPSILLSTYNSTFQSVTLVSGLSQVDDLGVWIILLVWYLGRLWWDKLGGKRLWRDKLAGI